MSRCRQDRTQRRCPVSNGRCGQPTAPGIRPRETRPPHLWQWASPIVFCPTENLRVGGPILHIPLMCLRSKGRLGEQPPGFTNLGRGSSEKHFYPRGFCT